MSRADQWESEMETEGAVYEADASGAPLHFHRAEDEYSALTGSAAVVDLSTRTRLELTGADRASFLHNLCTNEVRKLEAGTGCEAFFLNAKGHILGHGFIFAGPESHVVESAPGQAEALSAHLDRYVIREDVQVADRTAEWAEFLVGGPDAGEVLRRASGKSVTTNRLCGSDIELDGVQVHVRCVNITTPTSYVLLFPIEQRPKIWKALTDGGAHPCGQRAFETARIEAGFPVFGRDISDRNLPQEVARDQSAISFVKGCYIGQETVARIDALGHVNRALRGIKLDCQCVPEAGLTLNAAGQTIGEITSATFSPRLAAPMALAYIRRGYDAPGTMLECEHGSAEVISLPVESEARR